MSAHAGSPASPDHGPGEHLDGQIAWVQLEVGGDSREHLIKPEDRLHVAMV